MKEKIMKAKRRKPAGDEMRTEYDFSQAVRGKYYYRVMASTNVVVLDPDVAASFMSSQAVNEALRNLLRVAQEAVRPAKRPSGRGTKRRAA